MIRRALALALVVVASVAIAQASDEIELPAIHRTTLPNGLTIMVGESREVPLVQLSLLLPVGAARDVDAEAGLATLTAESLLRGAGPYGAQELAREIESIGGEIRTAVGYDATVVSAEFLADDVGRAVELLRLVVREPRFDGDEVRRARDEQVAAVAEAMERPQTIVERCFAAALYGGHPYGRSVYGARRTLAGLGRDRVRAFHRRWYRPAGATLTVVGAVDAERAEKLVQDAFADWRPCEQAVGGLRRLFGRAPSCAPDPAPRLAPPAPPGGARLVVVDKPDATQTQIRMGALAMARNDPDLLTADVANTVLGGGFSSILMAELRIERSLTYGAGSGYAARLVGGDFRIVTSTKTGTTVEATTLARQVLDRYRANGPAAPMLTKAKAYMRGQFPLGLETVAAVARTLAENAFYGLPDDYLTTYRGRVAAVTVEAATRAVREHMPASGDLTVVVLGPSAEIREPLEAAIGPATVVPAAACEDAQAALAR